MVSVTKRTVLVIRRDDGQEVELDVHVRSALVPELVRAECVPNRYNSGDISSFSPGTPSSDERRVICLLMMGRKIDAIKDWRQSRAEMADPWSLKRTKDFVEELERTMITAIETAKIWAGDKESRPPVVTRTDVSFSDEGVQEGGAEVMAKQVELETDFERMSRRPLPQLDKVTG